MSRVLADIYLDIEALVQARRSLNDAIARDTWSNAWRMARLCELGDPWAADAMICLVNRELSGVEWREDPALRRVRAVLLGNLRDLAGE